MCDGVKGRACQSCNMAMCLSHSQDSQDDDSMPMCRTAQMGMRINNSLPNRAVSYPTGCIMVLTSISHAFYAPQATI